MATLPSTFADVLGYEKGWGRAHVTSINTTAPSYINIADGLLESRVHAEKEKKYAEAAKLEGAEYITFGLFGLGGLTIPAQKLVRDLCRAAPWPVAPSELRLRIAEAVQRENGAIAAAARFDSC